MRKRCGGELISFAQQAANNVPGLKHTMFLLWIQCFSSFLAAFQFSVSFLEKIDKLLPFSILYLDPHKLYTVTPHGTDFP